MWNTKNSIKCPQLNRSHLKLKLFTDAAFKNLPNGESQTGRILFLTDCKNNTSPLYSYSSKIKWVVGQKQLLQLYLYQKDVMWQLLSRKYQDCN